MKVTYPSMFELMEDLRDMGESNAVIGRFVPILFRKRRIDENFVDVQPSTEIP
jgi:hypothetical protein